MKPIHLACLSAAFALATGAFAQGGAAPDPARGAGAPGMATPELPLVDAEVRRVDLARGLLVLKHGDIPNLGMGPMTMGFDVADRTMLQGLKTGQKLKFRADMLGGKATVTEIRVLR